MNSERVFEWQLGNFLGMPQSAAWTLLAIVAVVGIFLTAVFYHHTLRALTTRQRAIFIALRCGFFLSLLLCLAGPSRVERTYDSTGDSRPLAVLVDRSSSMTTPDLRGLSRLNAALKIWKKSESDASKAFPAIRYFQFSNALKSASTLQSATTDSASGSDTHLFDAIGQLMKEAPSGGYGGIVALTDGLDTTDATADEATSNALQVHTPLYFCVGQSGGLPHETLIVREFDVPGQVLRKSQFAARIVVEAHALHDRDVPLTLAVDGQSAGTTTLHLHAGANLVPWSVPLNSAEAGLLHLECKLGNGPDAETLAAAVNVVANEQTSILFYQGSLDWTYRFVRQALRNDRSFSLTGLFSQGVTVTRQISASSKDPVFTEMPTKAADLKPFHVVVLSNVFADQISLAQQTALADYVRAGGGILFLVSDTKMAGTFAGTTLESMMPVIFEAAGIGDARAATEATFQDQFSMSGAGDSYNEGATNIDPLTRFAFPPNQKKSDIANLFGAASTDPSSPTSALLQNLPQFSTFARVHGIKAGGEVLAVHPDAKGSDNQPRALLVTQRFGQGHVTALLTDGLWRWKLSLPSSAHDPEIFWQQLFHALASEQDQHGSLRFTEQPFAASLNQTADFKLDGAGGGNPPAITVTSPSGALQHIDTQRDDTGDSWTFRFKPDTAGQWRVRAVDGRGAQMETMLSVAVTVHGDELSGLPPDVDGLRTLAAATGGCLLDDGPPASWSESHAPSVTTLVSRRAEPLWDTWPLLALALGFYITELIWRRFAKLL